MNTNKNPFPDLKAFEKTGISSFEELALYCELHNLDLLSLCLFIFKSYAQLCTDYTRYMFNIVKKQYLNTQSTILSIYHSIGIDEPMFIPYLKQMVNRLELDTFICPKHLDIYPSLLIENNDTIKKLVFNDSIQQIRLPIVNSCKNLEEIVFPKEFLLPKELYNEKDFSYEKVFSKYDSINFEMIRNCPSIKKIVVPDNTVLKVENKTLIHGRPIVYNSITHTPPNKILYLIMENKTLQLFNDDIPLHSLGPLDIDKVEIVYHDGTPVKGYRNVLNINNLSYL